MRKKRNKRKKVRLALTQIALLRIEVAPFSDPPDTDAPTDLSSPSQYPYIEVGMVIMLNQWVKSLPREVRPLSRKPSQLTVMSVITVMILRKPLI
jgi:hypothetical protein